MLATMWGMQGGHSVSGGAAIAYTDDGQDGTNQTSKTFASINLGAASSDRFMLVGVSIRYTTGGNVSSLITPTLGGTTMTQLAINSTELDTPAIIYGLKVTSGTTADLVIDSDTDTMNRVSFIAAAVTGLVDVDSPEVYDTDISNVAAAAAFSSFSVAGDGVVFAHGLSHAGSDPGNYVWTGGVTEVLDATVESPARATAAIAAGADVSGTVTATPDTAPSEQHFVALCLR